MDTLDKIYAINAGLDKRFPGGSEPFKIIARLAEECGELAREVNHFEGAGVKIEKHGNPSVARLAKEVQDVLRAALQVAAHYGIQDDLAESIDGAYLNMQQEGLID